MASTDPVQVEEKALTAALAAHLAGPSAETSEVIWVYEGSEAVVHLDSLSVRVTPGEIQVRVDLETDQTGRATQEASVALALPSEPPNLVAVTDLVPPGDPMLSTRWGSILQEAVWTVVMDSANQLSGGRIVGVAAGDARLLVYRSDPPGTPGG